MEMPFGDQLVTKERSPPFNEISNLFCTGLVTKPIFQGDSQKVFLS